MTEQQINDVVSNLGNQIAQLTVNLAITQAENAELLRRLEATEADS